MTKEERIALMQRVIKEKGTSLRIHILQGLDSHAGTIDKVILDPCGGGILVTLVTRNGTYYKDSMLPFRVLVRTYPEYLPVRIKGTETRSYRKNARAENRRADS